MNITKKDNKYILEVEVSENTYKQLKKRTGARISFQKLFDLIILKYLNH